MIDYKVIINICELRYGYILTRPSP